MRNQARRYGQQVIAPVRDSRHNRMPVRGIRIARRHWQALCPFRSRAAAYGAVLVHAAQRLSPMDPLPPLQSRAARRGLAVTAFVALTFVLFFCAYLFAQQDAYLTHAEDMGIMTQALWNTMHGAPLHQTICDPVGDTNCLGDVSRLAIHFEPIMFLLAPLYALAPSPKTLQLIQVVLVAAGAFPAYWMATRRLGSAVAGVCFAVLYLLYPPLDAALTFDFHAVTLAAPFLMFALYFLVTRRSLGFLVACALAIGTKEEVALTVVMLGLYAALVQRRWRLGAGVALCALGWIVMEVLVMHAASPIGHSPMTSRYATFGSSPGAILVAVLTHPQVVVADLLDPRRLAYLGALLGPLAFVGLASPLALLLAAPVMALNMLSGQAIMYAGIAQYSAEIAPAMLFAAIDGTGKLASLGMRLAPHVSAAMRRVMRQVVRNAPQPRTWTRAWVWRLQEQPALVSLVVGIALAVTRLAAERWTALWCRARHWVRGHLARGRLVRRWSQRGWLRRVLPVAQLGLLAIVLVAGVAELGFQQRAGYLPFGRNFTWPQSSAHARLADTLVARIPATASVVTQSDLAPHLSNRRGVYLFPDQALAADYVVLDVTGNIFPFDDPRQYVVQVRAVLMSGVYALEVAQDGYLLLQRPTARHMTGIGAQAAPATGAAIDPDHLPESFYSFTQAIPAAVPHWLHGVTFKDGAAAIQLLGYDLSPNPNLYLNYPLLTVTTYWRVTGHLSQAVAPEIEVTYPSGYATTFTGFPVTDWLPVTAWPEGATMVVRSEPLPLARMEPGTVQIGVRLRTVDGGGALRARVLRGFVPGLLHVQAQPATGAHVPAPQVVISENRTLVAFAQEQVAK